MISTHISRGQERLSQEEKLALLAAIVESSDDAIVSKTLDGIVTSWNQGAERIFGYKPEEMIGKPITRLIPTDRLEEESRIIEQLRKGLRVEHFETVRKTKEGELIDISLTISPIRNGAGKIIGASKVARNITHIKELDRRKDDFIRMASHELKTPITSVKGYVQLASHMLQTPDFSEIREKYPPFVQALLSVENQVEKMISMITGMLDLSRIEAGKLDIQKAPFSISGFIEEHVRDIRLIAGDHEFTTETEVSGMLVADRHRMGQVLINLLNNAVKYSPVGTRIDVKATRQGNDLHISVQDQGIGIDAADQRRIFQRFYRVEGKNEQTYPGFGIGLYLAAEIMQLHGGRVEVESERGRGSRFTIIIPMISE